MSITDLDPLKIMAGLEYVSRKLLDMEEWGLSKELEKVKLDLDLYFEAQRQRAI